MIKAALRVGLLGILMDRYPVIHSASSESDGSGVEVETTAKGKRSLPNAAQLAARLDQRSRVHPLILTGVVHSETVCLAKFTDRSRLATQGSATSSRARGECFADALVAGTSSSSDSAGYRRRSDTYPKGGL